MNIFMLTLTALLFDVQCIFIKTEFKVKLTLFSHDQPQLKNMINMCVFLD